MAPDVDTIKAVAAAHARYVYSLESAGHYALLWYEGVSLDTMCYMHMDVAECRLLTEAHTFDAAVFMTRDDSVGVVAATIYHPDGRHVGRFAVTGNGNARSVGPPTWTPAPAPTPVISPSVGVVDKFDKRR